jgi:hypothetical protein
MSDLAGRLIAFYACWCAYRSVRRERSLRRLLVRWQLDAYRIDGWSFQWVPTAGGES